MKERIKLEKAKKNGKEPVTSGKEKQKQQGSSNKENQQRKEKKGQRQKDDNKEKEQKAKEKEERKKKKVEDKQRQALLLETQKSQAAARWASTCSSNPSHHKEAEVTVVGTIPVLLLYSHHYLFVAEILLRIKQSVVFFRVTLIPTWTQ